MALNFQRLTLLLVGASLALEPAMALPFVSVKTCSNIRPLSSENEGAEAVKWDWKDLVKLRGGFQLLDDYQEDEAADFYDDEDYDSEDEEEDDYAYDFSEGVSQPTRPAARAATTANSPFLDHFQGEVHNLVNDFREDVRKIFLQLKESIVLHRAAVKAAKEAQNQKKEAKDSKNHTKDEQKNENKEDAEPEVTIEVQSTEQKTPPKIMKQVPPFLDSGMAGNSNVNVPQVHHTPTRHPPKPVPVRGGFQVPGKNHVPQQQAVPQPSTASKNVGQQPQVQQQDNRHFVPPPPLNQPAHGSPASRPMHAPLPNQRPPSTFQQQRTLQQQPQFQQQQYQGYQARGYPPQSGPRMFQSTNTNTQQYAQGRFQG